MVTRLQRNRQKINEDLARADQRQFLSATCLAEYKRVWAALQIHVRGRCIDIGCGDMPYRDQLSGLVDSYVGFDVEARTTDVRYIGTVTDMCEVDDHQFDSALCLEVLEHVDNPEKGASEIFRILKPGGTLVCSVPHLSRLHEEPHDYFRFTHYGLRSVLERAGFEVIDLEATAGLFSFLGHQVSTLLTVPLWHLPVARQIMFFLNKWIVTYGSYALDQCVDRQRKFALGYVCVAKKPK